MEYGQTVRDLDLHVDTSRSPVTGEADEHRGVDPVQADCYVSLHPEEAVAADCSDRYPARCGCTNRSLEAVEALDTRDRAHRDRVEADDPALHLYADRGGLRLVWKAFESEAVDDLQARCL